MKHLAVLLLAVSMVSAEAQSRRLMLLRNAAAGGVSCTPSGTAAFEQTGTSDSTIGTASSTSVHRVGQVWTNGPTTTNLSEWVFEVTRSGGDVATKNYRVLVYSVSGTSLNTLLGQSDALLGTNAWLNTRVKWRTASPITIGPNAVVATVLYPDEGVDAVNVVAVGYINSGTVANGWVGYWNSTGSLMNTPSNGADACHGAFFCQ
jgi:hypothetical protein